VFHLFSIPLFKNKIKGIFIFSDILYFSMPRLDAEIVNRKILKSRTLAQKAIEEGGVFVDGKEVKKASKEVSPHSCIEVKFSMPYVSRGGLKLEKALSDFNLKKLDHKTVLDIGSSTGGFTDCSLAHGAKKVYAVDVGSVQFDETLKKNPKIELYEQTDIRSFLIPEPADLIVIDVSFISLTYIIPLLKNFLREGGDVIALVKPQFEVGKGNLTTKGLVKNEALYGEVFQKIEKSLEENNFKSLKRIESPIEGGDGNKEFLIHIKRNPS
jgi:23S rRNA (cytidine1920-2'-O)/16S rRNA (cytidine1409-2'-O)-methyltransferase